ncbi:MAG: hypothetical protein WDN45_13915 [Caulobacteraceae bacterium]
MTAPPTTSSFLWAEVEALAAGVDGDIEPDHALFAIGLDLDGDAFRIAGHVAGAGVHGVAHRLLLGHDQAHRAPAGGPAQAGHAQGQVVDSGLAGGDVEQGRHGVVADAFVAVGKGGGRNADGLAQADGIGPGAAGQVGETLESGRADEVHHRQPPG